MTFRQTLHSNVIFRFRKLLHPSTLSNRSSTQRKGIKQGARNLRHKRNLARENPIRQLQIGVIYQDNDEGRRKKHIFEVRYLFLIILFIQNENMNKKSEHKTCR